MFGLNILQRQQGLWLQTTAGTVAELAVFKTA
jgi:hypothetical protein